MKLELCFNIVAFVLCYSLRWCVMVILSLSGYPESTDIIDTGDLLQKSLTL